MPSPGQPRNSFVCRLSALRQKLHSAHVRMGDLWFYSAMLFAIHRGGDLVNIFIGFFLVPNFISQDDLGALLPLMAVGTVFAAPLGVILLPVGKFLNTFMARGEHGKAKALLQDSLVVVGIFAVALIGWMFWMGDEILLRLKVDNRALLWPVVGFAVIGCVLPKLQAAQRAMKLFKSTLIPPLVAPFIRLIGMLLLLPTIGVLGYLLTHLAMQTTTLLIIGGAVFVAMRGMSRRESYRAHWREMLRYSLPLLAMVIATRIQAPIELFVIRHRLPAIDSAGYYFVFMFGAIPTYFTNVITPYLMPLMSDRFERGESTRSLLLQPMLFNLAVGGGFTILAAFLMPLIFHIPGPWTKYAAYAGFVWQVSLINTLKTSVQFFKTHEHACRNFTYMWYIVPIMLLEAAVLYLLPAWSIMRPYLPESLWSWVNQYSEPNLQRFVGIMIAAHGLCFAGNLIHIFFRNDFKRHSSKKNYNHKAIK